MNTPIEKTQFFSDKRENKTFINMIKNNEEVIAVYHKANTLHDFFDKILTDKFIFEEFYCYISSKFPGHLERVTNIFKQGKYFTTTSNAGSILLYYGKYAEILIPNYFESDDENYVTILNNFKNFNLGYFMKSIDVVIKGKYKISEIDIEQEPSGYRLNGIYEVFTANIEDKSFVAFQKVDELEY